MTSRQQQLPKTSDQSPFTSQQGQITNDQSAIALKRIHLGCFGRMTDSHVDWSVVVGHWSLVIVDWRLVIDHGLLVTGHWSFVIVDCLCVGRLLIVDCGLLSTQSSLVVVD